MQARSVSGSGRIRPGLAILSLLACMAGTGPAIAQTQSPLSGKTIRVFNPTPGEPLFVEISGQGYPMAPDSGTRWMSHTVADTLPTHLDRFGIRNAYGQDAYWIGRTGVAAVGADAFSAADFGSGNTLWIVIDPSGPATAAPTLLTEAPKVVNVFNPWPTTAPVLSLAGGTRKGMLTVAGNCGWFWAFLLKPAEHSFFLEEVNGADAYGSGGLGNRTAYNLTTEFASKGSTLWLDTEINAWLAADPKKNRPCGYQMAATVRDFSQSHVDFDFGQAANEVVTAMVEAVLPANRKPVRTAKTHPYFNQFDDWFNTKAGINEETCVDIPMTQTGDGMWMYDSYTTPEHGFYPIDEFNTTDAGAPNPHNQKNIASCYVKPDGTSWVTGGPMRNFNFCLETHATFIYQRGQKFEFRGDDDVWVYINNKLATDLGGIHTPVTDTVDLDLLGLTPGQTYNWDLFICDRQPCASTLRIKTSIFFKQQRALEAVPDPAKPGVYRIVKYVGGSGACGSVGTDLKEVPVPPGSLIYKLWNASGSELESLGEGSFQNGGIVIATPGVVVDTSKITALPPGNYRVVAFEPASPTIKAEIPFTVGNRNGVEFEPPLSADYPNNSSARIVVANRMDGKVKAQVAPYTLVIPAGLSVFLDAALTLRAVPGGPLSTSATGYDTLWAVAASDSTLDRTYVLSIPTSSRTLVLTFRTGSSTAQAKLGKLDKASSRGRRRDVLGRTRQAGRPVLKPRVLMLPKN